MWWLSARIRHEREHCCDELAVKALGSRVDCGRAVLALDELRGATPVLSLGAKGGSLLERIRRLAESVSSSRVGLGGIFSFALPFTLILVGAAVWDVTQANQTSDVQAEAPVPNEVPVVIAIQPLAKGTMIEADHVAARLWPKDIVPKGTLGKVEETIGKTTLVSINPGEPLFARNLSEGGLFVTTPPGMRAFRLPPPPAV